MLYLSQISGLRVDLYYSEGLKLLQNMVFAFPVFELSLKAYFYFFFIIYIFAI